MKSFLKCDAAGCGHDESIAALTEDLVGKECPKCGADLLTADDYAAGKAHEAMLLMLERLGIASDSEADISEGAIKIVVNPHKGKTNITMSPVNKPSP